MPMKTAYFTVDGEILAQEASGQRVDYLPDALGSVVTTTDQKKDVAGTNRYKPYGGDLARLGQVIRFGWVGRPGYRVNPGAAYTHYIRSRAYHYGSGLWTSRDPLLDRLRTKGIIPYGSLHAFAYANNSPASLIDPTGLYGKPPSDPIRPKSCAGFSAPITLVPAWLKLLKPRFKGKVCADCYSCPNERECEQDPYCPKATKSYEASLSFCVSIPSLDVSWADFFDFIKAKDTANMLISFVSGAALLAKNCSEPKEECHDIMAEATASVCGGFCFLAMEGKACGGFIHREHCGKITNKWETWTSGPNLSNCGVMKFELCLTGAFKEFL